MSVCGRFPALHVMIEIVIDFGNLVLMDMNMPVMDGITVGNRIHRGKNNS